MGPDWLELLVPRLLLWQGCSNISDTLDPLQNTYLPNRSTDDTISTALHTALTHIDKLNTYSALRKYSAPLNFATVCHVSDLKHKDMKLYFCVKNQQQVGHNHEVEQHLLDISNFFFKSKTEKLGVQNYYYIYITEI
jgi:hypothetical protein